MRRLNAVNYERHAQGGIMLRDAAGGIHAPENKDLGWQAALRPEAALKRKKTFSKIKHSQQENNSQHGTMWITNETDNKKIKKDSCVPDGWRKGRVMQ